MTQQVTTQHGPFTPPDIDAGYRSPLTFTGPLRSPLQMLAEQVYGDHASIHDESVAGDLGLTGAPIEGPTHFSQFDPLLTARFGRRWFERGCISAHFVTMCVEGDEVRASAVTSPQTPQTVQIAAEKADGTPVLAGTASIADDPDTEVRRRLARARAPQNPVILDQLRIGQRGNDIEPVTMGLDPHGRALSVHASPETPEDH